MQILLLVKFKNYLKDKNYFRELQKLYKCIKKITETKFEEPDEDVDNQNDLNNIKKNILYSIESPKMKDQFEEFTDNCDLFLLFDCLRRKFDEKFATLVLALVDKNIRRVWKSLEISKYSVLTINQSYRGVIELLNKYLPKIRVFYKSNRKVKFSLQIEDILKIVKEDEKKIEILDKNIDEMVISWSRHIIYHKLLVKNNDILLFKDTKVKVNPDDLLDGADVGDSANCSTRADKIQKDWSSVVYVPVSRELQMAALLAEHDFIKEVEYMVIKDMDITDINLAKLASKVTVCVMLKNVTGDHGCIFF